MRERQGSFREIADRMVGRGPGSIFVHPDDRKALAKEFLRLEAAAQRVLDYSMKHHLRGDAAVVSDELLEELRGEE